MPNAQHNSLTPVQEETVAEDSDLAENLTSVKEENRIPRTMYRPGGQATHTLVQELT